MDRSWMYNIDRLIDGHIINPDFERPLLEFITFASSNPRFANRGNIRCPCNRPKCRNKSFQDPETIKVHGITEGFVPHYYNWVHHGEPRFSLTGYYNHMVGSNTQVPEYEYDPCGNNHESSEVNVVGHELNAYVAEDDQPPIASSQMLYNRLGASSEPIWPGSNESKLSVVSELIHLKAQYRIPNACYDELCRIMQRLMPEDNVMPKNIYETKKLVRDMGLPVQKIHCCRNGCMIYWGCDSELSECKFCGHPRYKDNAGEGSSNRKAYKKMYYFPLTPRLQRLYASEVTAKHMRWHAEHQTDEGDLMCHPSDSLAWKYFDQEHPTFSYETRNVRLGLCTDGFQPFGQSGQQYSLWPVIVTPYNLPPSMCMKDEFMFLTIIVPGPRNPKYNIDVFLQPLIAELIHLWDVGEVTYDLSTKHNFLLRAALLWTINDFPAYGMLSGWSTAGRTACPYCMEESEAFTLQHGGKQSWFDNHRKFLPHNHHFRRNTTAFRKGKKVLNNPLVIKSGSEILNEIDYWGFLKVTELDAVEINGQLAQLCGWKKRSIFWDLPYWSSNLIRRIFNTIMNVEGKTKDNVKSRADLQLYCDRPELTNQDDFGRYPKACYTLDKQRQKVLCDWVKDLKFSDGFASNFARCVDMKKLKLFGMKSHDCHVFMQRLIPIAFQELLPRNVWETLTELSLFFKDLTSTVIKEADMRRLEKDIPIILCKLERFFPPSFFDSMEHLPIHMAYEAMIGEPVHFRWMYPFERFFRKLKGSIGNNAHVEGSICNSYETVEGSKFFHYYFPKVANTSSVQLMPNSYEEHPDILSIFAQHKAEMIGKGNEIYLSDEEIAAAHTYILLNCTEVEPFIETYQRYCQPHLSDALIDATLDAEFSKWFNKFGQEPMNNITNIFLKALAMGPLRLVKSFSGYKEGYNDWGVVFFLMFDNNELNC
ncbi:hypothetical protein GQ457_04G005670 [Hibiscus cannabinus]